MDDKQYLAEVFQEIFSFPDRGKRRSPMHSGIDIKPESASHNDAQPPEPESARVGPAIATPAAEPQRKRSKAKKANSGRRR